MLIGGIFAECIKQLSVKSIFSLINAFKSVKFFTWRRNRTDIDVSSQEIPIEGRRIQANQKRAIKGCFFQVKTSRRNIPLSHIDGGVIFHAWSEPWELRWGVSVPRGTPVLLLGDIQRALEGRGKKEGVDPITRGPPKLMLSLPLLVALEEREGWKKWWDGEKDFEKIFRRRGSSKHSSWIKDCLDRGNFHVAGVR